MIRLGLEPKTQIIVAFLYGVETREINQAVKNNLEKFPARYMFELTPNELSDLKSKILISKVSNNSRRGATKAFTERGLYMLATILKGERARQVTDIVMPDLQTSETESSLEINFFIGKIKHTVKRVRKEK